VADVVAANVAAADKANTHCNGEVFNIGAGRNKSVNDVTELILKMAKSTIMPLHAPPVIEAKDSLADISKAKSFLGWQPRVSFEKGLNLTYDYFAASAKAI
jgi:nucleoside-diphosphate-sugar epimerase